MSLEQIIVESNQIKKMFDDFVAIRSVTLNIRRGECFGLLGPNGAGKSTFINMIYGATNRSAGDLKVFGMDPDRFSRQIKKRLGVVTQENALDEGLSVRENMEIYATFVGLPKTKRNDKVTSLLEFLNLAHKQHDPIRFLSGGMKRRLVFVRALLSDPELVILDEPTTGLDPAVRHLLWGKVNELKAQGKTVILTTHYMHEAEVLCDRLVIMNQGAVIAEGSPDALRAQHTPGYVAAFAKDSSDLAMLAKKSGLQLIEDSSGIYVRAPHFEQLLEFQNSSGRAALQLRPSNLEDVFLKLTGQELTADA